MNETETIRFILQNSSEPVIKNPVMRAALQEPRTMAQGGRIGLFMGGSEASQKGAIASAKKRKINVTEVSEELAEKIKNTKLKGTGVAIETTSGGGKVIRVKMTNPVLDAFKIDSLPATEENLKKIQNHLNNIKNTKTYKKIIPWKGSKEKLAIKKGKYEEIKKGDPEHIYKKTQKKKTQIFPDETSKTKQIHHSKKKSLPQTTEKWFLIDDKLNNLDSLKDAETARDGLYAERNRIRDSKTKSIADKTRGMDEINAKLKRIIKNKKFKSTEGKGLVDITLESMDEAGKIISKDMGADISKSMGWKTKTGKLDLTKLKSGEGKKVLGELEEKLLTHLKSNPKLAIEIKKQLDAGYDMTKILNSPAVKKGMPTWVKGELAFAAADIMNNWTKGQSFWKGLGKGIETGSFGVLDFNTDKRALLSKGKKLVDQGVITQQEFDSMEGWLEYTEALKNRRATQEDYYSAAEDLKENEDLSGGKNILAGETAGWNTLEAGVKAGGKQSDIADKNLDQSIDSYNSITDEGSMGYNTMSKVMDHLVGEEWNKPAGTVIDRGKRRNQGEGNIWGGIGGVLSDTWGLLSSPWRDDPMDKTLEQIKMNLGLKETTPQDRIMQHPVHGFEEAKLKHPEAWEDIAYDMESSINPTEQLWKAEGGIMSLKKK